jgi:hypothetical protein
VYSRIGQYNPFDCFDDYLETVRYFYPFSDGAIVLRQEDCPNPHGGIDRLCWLDIAANKFLIRVETAQMLLLDLWKKKEFDFVCSESFVQSMHKFLLKVGFQQLNDMDGKPSNIFSLDFRDSKNA